MNAFVVENASGSASAPSSPNPANTLLNELLAIVVSRPSLHCRWLNSLSLLENSGARKISVAQHPMTVTESMLRHTVEESRHAWYLKRQIEKLRPGACPTYEPDFLLAPAVTRRYLDRLDVAICRLLKTQLNLSGYDLSAKAYLLVTYAIEVQADRLYGAYDKVLARSNSDVSVRSILAEEETHLAEMKAQISALFPEAPGWCTQAEAIEDRLFQRWLAAVAADVQAEV